jgi:hypothetical protein
MKNGTIITCLMLLTFLIASCSQGKNDSKEIIEINNRLTYFSNKIERFQSVLERIVFDEKTLDSIKTNREIIGPIIESAVINYQLNHANLEKIEKSLLQTQEEINQASHVKIDPFEESIYPVKTRYGALVLWVKSAQNNVGGIEVKLKIVNTLSVGIGDLVLIFKADCTSKFKSGKDNKMEMNYFSFGKLDKIEPGEAKDLSIVFDGVNIKDVDHFIGSIGLQRIYLK